MGVSALRRMTFMALASDASLRHFLARGPLTFDPSAMMSLLDFGKAFAQHCKQHRLHDAESISEDHKRYVKDLEGMNKGYAMCSQWMPTDSALYPPHLLSCLLLVHPLPPPPPHARSQFKTQCKASLESKQRQQSRQGGVVRGFDFYVANSFAMAGDELRLAMFELTYSPDELVAYGAKCVERVEEFRAACSREHDEMQRFSSTLHSASKLIFTQLATLVAATARFTQFLETAKLLASEAASLTTIERTDKLEEAGHTLEEALRVARATCKELREDKREMQRVLGAQENEGRDDIASYDEFHELRLRLLTKDGRSKAKFDFDHKRRDGTSLD